VKRNQRYIFRVALLEPDIERFGLLDAANGADDPVESLVFDGYG
jgi:hypothetical protein